MEEDEALSLAYADDVAVVATIPNSKAARVLNNWNSELRDACMEINKRKLK